MDAEQYYTDHLKQINEAITIICRKHGMAGDEEKDFAQHVHLQLIENDYKKLRAFKGSSSLKTYLYTVISRIFIDQVRHKWHPSAEARRMGAIAVELEKLVYQHQYETHEACQILATNPATALDESTVHEMLGKLRRNPRVAILEDSEERLPGYPDSAPDPEERIELKQLKQRKQTILALVGDALRSLSEEDRLLIKLYFVGGHKISTIARMLGQDDRMLYRRTQVMLQNLRQHLAEAGVGPVEVQDVLQKLGEHYD